MTTTDKTVRVEPFITSNQTLPEITARALILGVLLAIILAASNTFVGLKIARTISASIPAAMVSMVVLRGWLFRRIRQTNILENNMAQTIASAGEVVASGIIFTLPALVLMGYWESFNYLQTAAIATIGGLLGVFFSVPLRRSMLVKDNLPYPEGVATGEVLKAGEDTHTGSTKVLLIASLFSALISFLQTGFKIAGEQIQYWTKAGTTAFGGSLMLSPVLMAAGYIVGMRGLIAFAVGGVLTWSIGIPLFVAVNGLPEAGDVGSALAMVQKSQFRFVAVGVMAVGGIWCVISLVKQIGEAFKASFTAMKSHRSEFASTPRTERDIPFKYVLLGVICLAIPTFVLFYSMVEGAQLISNSGGFWSTVLFGMFFSLLMGFIAASVAAYVVGIVGSTSLPVSGIAIASIIAFASFLLILLKSHIDFSIDTNAAIKAAAIVIVFAAVVCVAAAVSGDNMQDLKAGQIVGATPWKQQLMLGVGAIASALVIPYILQTTFEAYGIGDVLPRPNMNPAKSLPAPQATLMATVAKGFFSRELPWNMLFGGAAIAVVAICLDEYLKYTKSQFRFPVLLFALGIYFPLGMVTAFCLGGVIRLFVDQGRGGKEEVTDSNLGILCASGIIAGEAMLGALLTIPFAYYQTTDVFALNIESITRFENWIGIVMFAALCAYLYKQGRTKVSHRKAHKH